MEFKMGTNDESNALATKLTEQAFNELPNISNIRWGAHMRHWAWCVRLTDHSDELSSVGRQDITNSPNELCYLVVEVVNCLI